MFRRVCEILKQQRLAQSSAVIVGLILIKVAHAPILPVVAGCLLAMGIIVLRGLFRPTKPLPAQGSQ
jgi:hypothetical protein